jgi:hypothetical protein
MSEDAPMYIYATEMVHTYYTRLNIKGCSILTVCGSGDQVLNAIALEAKEVIGFDLNKNSESITRLKMAAIKELDYGEFLDFFSGKGRLNIRFDYPLYQKLRHSLDLKTAKFFDRLYRGFKFKGNKLASSSNFRERNRFVGNRIKLINGYLKNEHAYLSLRRLLSHSRFHFIHSDVRRLADLWYYKRRFDIINLSNVPGYITAYLEEQGEKDPFSYLVNNVIAPLSSLISRGGLIFYYRHSNSIYPNKIADSPSPADLNFNLNRPEFRKHWRISKKRFKGIRDDTLDGIVIFRQGSS